MYHQGFLYFINRGNNYELWKTDGTVKGTCEISAGKTMNANNAFIGEGEKNLYYLNGSKLYIIE